MTARHVLLAASILGALSLSGSEDIAKRSRRVLSRPRRYLVFPEGSTMNTAFCMENKMLIPADSGIWTMGVAYILSYDLPNSTDVLASLGSGVGEDPSLDGRRRRDRRELYRKLETAVDSAGVPGRECVLRSVCEAQQLLDRQWGLSIFHEMLRIIFAVPLGRVSAREPPDVREYVGARRHGLRGLDCGALYAACPVSLLSLVLSLKPVSAL